jgi:acyl-CoA thioester hydrolase
LTSSTDARPLDYSRGDYRYWQQVSTRWVDNDAYGHINNAVYFSYIDSVVNQFLIEHQLLDIEKSEAIGLVAQSQCRFFQSLSYPGTVDCGLRVTHLGNTSVSYEVGMFAQGKETAAAVGGFTHVFVDRSQRRPRPLSEPMRSALSTLA